ncbi:MAG: DUF1404 family protein [Metallosphaera sp.]|uniref:DUF1404 family protein n=1 Tax=Metallosphaera sp. TaxID=2020860 RepID=UPI00315F50F6
MRRVKLFLIFLFTFILLNPVFERVYGENATAFMASHYVLFALGFWLGLSFRSLKHRLIRTIIGSAIAVLVHTPTVFDDSAYYEILRIVLELALFSSGYLIGSSLSFGWDRYAYSLLGGWMIGDTSLSIAFMIGDPNYSYPLSPFQTWQIKDAGMFMFLFMNLVAFFIVMRIFVSYVERT